VAAATQGIGGAHGPGGRTPRELKESVQGLGNRLQVGSLFSSACPLCSQVQSCIFPFPALIPGPQEGVYMGRGRVYEEGW
jgi:hypothetical protein